MLVSRNVFHVVSAALQSIVCLDETVGIQNNIGETSWQNGASFYVKMFVKYEIRAGSVSSGVRMQVSQLLLNSNALGSNFLTHFSISLILTCVDCKRKLCS